MQNQNNQENLQENKNFKDQADGKLNPVKDKKRVSEHDADDEVRENEDASLQDKTYSFDEENTDTEEYHDADDSDLGDVDKNGNENDLH